MKVLAEVAIPFCLACAIGSPMSRRTFGRFLRGAGKAMAPRGLFMGCGLWLLLWWLVGVAVLAGLFVLVVVSPSLAVADIIGWLARRRNPAGISR